MKTMHSCVTLDYLEQRIREAGIRFTQGGQSLSLEESLAEIKAMRDKGYIYCPPCDNVDKEGHCKGHST